MKILRQTVHEIFTKEETGNGNTKYFLSACAETGTSVHPSTNLTAPFKSATPKTCIVVTFSLYDEGCGRKSHIFTAHAQKRAQVYIRAQF